MLLYKQEEAGIQLNAEQADWKDDTDDYELEAHYMYMTQLQEVSLDPANSKPIFDDEPLQKIDQNDDDNDLATERELLASLIEKLKCEIDESKNQLVRRNSKEYASQMELECEKVRGDLLSYKMDYQKSCTKYTDTINALNQTISEMKDKLSAHQETISILSQQKEAQIKLYKTQEDKELDKVIELEHKVKANPRLYDIGCYNDNLALMLASDSDEVIRLEKESRSKLSDLIRPFDYDKLNNLYDLFVPQCEKSFEQHYFSKRYRLSHINVNNGKSKEAFNKQTTLLEKR
nr:hypothetical protein [Tanacetum cinerariifolium]